MSLTEEEGPNPSSETIVINDHRHDRSRRFDLLSKIIGQDLDLMSNADVSPEAVKHGIDELAVQIDEARTKFNQIRTKKESLSPTPAAGDAQTHLELERDLQQLKKKVTTLKSMFPFCVLKKPIPTNSHINWRDRSTPHSVSAPDKLMLNVTSNDNFNRIPTFDQLKTLVRRLNNRSRICLICFLVFPENAIIKKSLLVCWAKTHSIGFLDEPVEDLIENGLIRLVYKDSLTLGGYWMHPSVRATLVDENWLQVSDLGEWVYVADSTSEEDIIYDDPSKFLAKKELRMLHLGNWQRSSVRHVEVEEPDSFFRDMDQLSKLRYVSLRGISLVTEIPNFITKLHNLEILDLKACYNLEVLPSDIDSLSSSLTHLDMSECYFLEHMPMALSRLINLRVLKGFVVGEANRENSCTLRDLLNLEDLMKLNIYSSDKSFPDDYQLSILKEFKFLHSLTISWGGCSAKTSQSTVVTKPQSIKRQGQEEPPPPAASGSGGQKGRFTHRHSTITNKEISFNLEKLDLQCVPETVTPSWLKPANFKHVNNLYIRGGQFSDLGQQGGNQTKECHWDVEILRLKHLSNLEMDYRELVRLFPKLICLETLDCPKLKNFPGGDEGVWKKETTIEPPPTTYH